MDIFAVVEHRNGSVRPVTFEAVEAANEIAQMVDGRVRALVLGQDTSEIAAEVTRAPVDDVVILQNEFFDEYSSYYYARGLTEVLEAKDGYLVVPHSTYGSDLAPYVGGHTKCPVISDVVRIEEFDGAPTFFRQEYLGKVEVGVRPRKQGLTVVSVRPGSFPEASQSDSEKPTKTLSLDVEPDGITVDGFERQEEEGVDISDADVVVAVGRGIGEEENLGVVEKLAETIGGAIGASRPIVDNNWLPKNRQVGQTGKTVKPRLYIAIGISGAMQHVMGMKNSETILSINTDPDAPIFDHSHYGAVADLFDVVPLLTEKLQKKLGS